MAHSGDPPPSPQQLQHYNEPHEYLQPKLEQQPYVLPSSAYDEASASMPSSSKQHHRQEQPLAEHQFFGRTFNGSSNSNVAAESGQLNQFQSVVSDHHDSVVRFDDQMPTGQQQQQFTYFQVGEQQQQQQPNFDEQQQIFRADQPPAWFSWLPSTTGNMTTNDNSSLAPRPPPSFNDNTVLINTLLDSANMNGLPVDINSAYEANRIQIQDVYRAVEFEMHRRLSIPQATQHSTGEAAINGKTVPAEFPPQNSSSSSSLIRFHANTAKGSNMIGVESSNNHQHDSTSWLNMLQRSTALAADEAASDRNLSLQQHPLAFFGTSQAPISNKDDKQPTSSSTSNGPPTPHGNNPSEHAHHPPVFLPPPASSATSSTAHAKLTEYVNIEQVMKSQQPAIATSTSTIMEKKPFQKPLTQIPTSVQQRRSSTTPLSGTPKKRTAVFSQFTGMNTTTASSHSNNTSFLGPLKKIKTEANSSSSVEAAGSGADDDEYAGEDTSDSCSNISDINGRAVAAVLAPLARSANSSNASASGNDGNNNTSGGVDARDNVLVCYTFWRLALVKKVRREVTLGEIRRRLAPPESFTLSQLGSLLRLAKVRGSGPALKQRLEHYGLKVESSQRTQARQTLFMALLESEANTMANEYKTLCMRHFPRRSLAEYFVHKRHTQPQSVAQSLSNGPSNNTDPNSYRTHLSAYPRQHTNANAAAAVSEEKATKPENETLPATAMPDKPDDLIACADTLAELRTALLLDRSPLMANCEPAANNTQQRLPSAVQDELNNFSASTHGFGTQTIVHHIALLEDVLKFMARCYAAPSNMTASNVMAASNSMGDFENENALLVHHHAQPVPQQQQGW